MFAIRDLAPCYFHVTHCPPWYGNVDRGVKPPHLLLVAVSCGYSSLEGKTHVPSGTRPVSKMGIMMGTQSAWVELNLHLCMHMYLYTPATLLAK